MDALTHLTHLTHLTPTRAPPQISSCGPLGDQVPGAAVGSHRLRPVHSGPEPLAPTMREPNPGNSSTLALSIRRPPSNSPRRALLSLRYSIRAILPPADYRLSVTYHSRASSSGGSDHTVASLQRRRYWGRRCG